MSDLTDDKADWERIYDEIASRVLKENSYDINAETHLKTAKHLMAGVYKGLGGGTISYDEDRAVLVEYLQRNIYAFSAAKSFVQMQYYRDMMIGEDGKLLSFESYRKRIANAGEIFNNTYLRAEYDNAYQSAIMAHKWDTMNTDYLQYTTVGDSNVRPEHKALDKFTAPKSDVVWRRIYPPNGWNCRCTVVPGKEAMSEQKMTAIEAGRIMKEHLKDSPFDNNVGLSRIIFKDNHPYFQNAKGKIANLSWEQYGLPNIDKIRANPLPEYKPTTKEQYLEWWAKQPKKSGDDFIVKDILRQEILLSSGEGKNKNIHSFFKDHILKKESEKRFEYATETKKILTTPDEVWLNPQDKNNRIYLKHYEQGTLKLVVDEKLEAVTLFRLHSKNSGELYESRKGILLYRK